jgi:Sulfatase
VGARLRQERPRLLVCALHLAVLWAFAIAQPLFEVLGDNAAFFAIRGSEPLDIVVFAVGLVVLPPLAMVAVETLATALEPRVGLVVHWVLVGALVALLALQVLERLLSDSSGTLLIALAIVIGVLAATAYALARPLRSVVTVLAPAPLVFLLIFIFFSPVTKLVFPDDGDARAAGVPGRHPIVMVVLDQFPLPSLLGADGRIDAQRYPNFAKLASGSYWFPNTAATSDLTELAVPAVLTGDRPAPDDLPILADHPRNLFTLLNRSHDLQVTETVTHLCPRAVCRVRRPGFADRMDSLLSDVRVVGLRMVLPSDLDDEVPSVAGRWQGFAEADDQPTDVPNALDADQRVADLRNLRSRREQFDRFVGSIKADDGGRPPFHFIHLLLPHFPFEYLPSGRSYGNPNLIVGLDDELQWSSDPAAVERAYQRHVLQVGFVDRQLGQLLRRLRSTGLYDGSLLVLTADHGATFRPGEPLLGWGAPTVHDMLPVPLFIKAPGQRQGETVDAHLQTIDVVPTMADLLDLRIPWRVDGHSGLSRDADRRAGLLHHPRDDPMEFSFTTFDRELQQALRRKLALFGSGSAERLYEVGPRTELLGRDVGDFPAARAVGLRAKLDRPSAFDVVPARSRFVPAHVTAELRGPRAGQPVVVAMALNGRIAAVARSVPQRGSSAALLSAILPESAFRSGVNQLRLLAVSSAGDRTTLAPLARTPAQPAPFVLRADEIRAPGSRTLPIDSGAVDGFVDRTEASSDEVRFYGWAAVPPQGSPVERILVFAGGEFALAVEPEEPRPDVAKLFGGPERNLGFAFTLSADLALNADVEVFALAEGGASRIPYLCKPDIRQAVGC